MSDNLFLILGNQLFETKILKESGCTRVFMAEDFGLTTNHKHHKLKILMFLWSMRQYRDNLIKNGYTVFYHSIEEEMTPGVQLLIAKDGKVVYNKSYGYQTFKKKRQ